MKPTKHEHRTLLLDMPISFPQAEMPKMREQAMVILNKGENIVNLYDETSDYPTPIQRLKGLGLVEGFSQLRWIKLSKKLIESSMTKDNKNNIDVRALRDAIVRFGAKDFVPITSAIMESAKAINIEMFIMGDTVEVFKIVELVSHKDFKLPALRLTWKAFTPDPYLGNSVMENAKIAHLSLTHQLYDLYMGRWLSGIDGQGNFSTLNMRWLASRPVEQKSYFVYAGIDRINYLVDYDATTIRSYYRLVLGALFSCREGGTAIIRLPLPSIKAIYGLYGLIKTHFLSVRLIKQFTDLPDDDIAYVVATGFSESSLLPSLLDKPMDVVLSSFAAVTNSFALEMRAISDSSIHDHINAVNKAWSKRVN